MEVIIGDESEAISIKDLFVNFTIRKDAHGTPASGTIQIYNLNKNTENQIRERGERVQLLVGYGRTPDLSLIFSGDIRRVDRDSPTTDEGKELKEKLTRLRRTRSGGDEVSPIYEEQQTLDRIIKLSVGGHIASRTDSMFVKTYQSPVGLRTILTDIVDSMDGLTIGPLTVIPSGLRLPSWSYSGPSVDAIENLIGRLNGEIIKQLDDPNVAARILIRWYIDDDIVKFASDNSSLSGVPHWVINEASGMIGSPGVTDDGLKVRLLMDPRLRLQDNVSVESQVIEDRGLHQIVSIEHTGDNRGGDFYTNLELRPIQSRLILNE